MASGRASGDSIARSHTQRAAAAAAAAADCGVLNASREWVSTTVFDQLEEASFVSVTSSHFNYPSGTIQNFLCTQLLMVVRLL